MWQEKECHRFGCDQAARSICQGCKASAYCSVACQRLAWPMHKRLCDTKLANRMRAFCSVLMEYGDTTSVVPNLSETHIIYVDGKKSWMGAFLYANRWQQYCAACEIKVGARKGHVFPVTHEGVRFYYSLCKGCRTMQRLLCPLTLMVKKECDKTRQFLRPLMLLGEITMVLHLLPYDVFNVIRNLFIDSVRYCDCMCGGEECAEIEIDYEHLLPPGFIDLPHISAIFQCDDII